MPVSLRIERVLDARGFPDEAAAERWRERALELGTEAVVEEVRRSIQTTFKTADEGEGHLYSSIESTPGHVWSSHPSARALELGADIYPQQAESLHWTTEAGEEIFAQHVHIDPHPWFAPAVEKAGREGGVVDQAIRKAWTEMIGG